MGNVTTFRSEKSASGLTPETVEGAFAENLYCVGLDNALTNATRYAIQSTFRRNMGARTIPVSTSVLSEFDVGDYFMIVGRQNGGLVAEMRKVEHTANGLIFFDIPLSFYYDSVSSDPEGLYKVGDESGEISVEDACSTIQKVIIPFTYNSLEINDTDTTYNSHRILDFTNKKTPTRLYVTRTSYNATYNRAYVLRPEIIISAVGQTISKMQNPSDGTAATVDSGQTFRSGTVNIELEGTAARSALGVSSSSLVDIENYGLVVSDDLDAPDMTYRGEVRGIKLAAGVGSNGVRVVLDAPLLQEYSSPEVRLVPINTNNPSLFKHFVEGDRAELNSYTINESRISTQSNDEYRARRMLGCKVSGMEISADSGNPVTLGLAFEALNSLSKITGRPDTGNTYTFPVLNRNNIQLPDDELFMFKQGRFDVFAPSTSGARASTIAGSVDNFSLNINNSLEPKYYADGTCNNEKFNPTRILTAERSITLNVTLRFIWDAEADEFDIWAVYEALQNSRTDPGLDIELRFARGTDEILDMFTGDVR